MKSKPKTRPRQPKIALKSIKVNLGLSEETFCFTATLWVDGKRFGEIKNHGHGGPDDVYPKSGNYDDVNALAMRVRETFPRICTEEDDPPIIQANFPEGLAASLESVCSELISDHLMAQDLKRLLRTNYLAKRISGGGVFQWKKRDFGMGEVGGTKKRGAICAFELMARHKGYQPLNSLPFDEALAIFKTEGAKR